MERHGDILKHMLDRLDTEKAIHDQTSFDQALLPCCQAKNAMVRHFGYSPEQIVLGKAIQVPASNSSDESGTSHSLANGEDLESEHHRQRLELRTKARQAFLEADNSQAIRRAILRRSNPMRGPFRAGDWVLYWIPKSPNRLAAGRWHGPSRVICSEGLSTVWLSHGHKMIRCAPEQHLRPASLREWQTVQDQALTDPLLETQRDGGASSFMDLQPQSSGNVPAPVPVVHLPIPMPITPETQAPVSHGPPSNASEQDVPQPEYEMTPQVSHRDQSMNQPLEVPRVELESSSFWNSGRSSSAKFVTGSIHPPWK